jgi:hypothetical protein
MPGKDSAAFIHPDQVIQNILQVGIGHSADWPLAALQTAILYPMSFARAARRLLRIRR